MSPPRPVGYYVHHHGAGHGALASAAAAALDLPVVGMGSRPPPAGWPGEWLALPRDDDPAPAGDPTAGGAWHWAPSRHPGFAERMAAIAAWVGGARPSALVVDVSCEVAGLGVLMGVPTLPVMFHGRRDDRAHRMTWDGATTILAAWPRQHAEAWQAPWSDRIAHLGLTSRFDDRPPPGPVAGREVVVLLPAGGIAFGPAHVEAAARATAAAGWSWTVVGAPPPHPDAVASWVGHAPDPWELLGRARVVVSATGSGSVADVAAARRPAVLLPQDRPFDEQRSLAAHLAVAAPVVVRRCWPEPSAWPDLLAEAAALDPDTWSALHDRRGAARLAAAVTRAAG